MALKGPCVVPALIGWYLMKQIIQTEETENDVDESYMERLIQSVRRHN